VLVTITTVAILMACYEWKPLICKSDRVCITADEVEGLCIQADNKVKYCAFPAADCPSGWRWLVFSDEYSNKCVDPALVPRDGGVDGSGGMDGSGGVDGGGD
jgi:hypothetical protein